MKRRYVYAILIGVPGFLISLLITFMFFGFLAGFLWLYVFGDDTWPAYIENLLPILFIITFLGLWSVSVIYGYLTGKRLEDGSRLDPRHVLISVAASLLPLALILIYTFRAGNVGPIPVTVRCSEYCISQGYTMSSMTSRDDGEMVCSCLDEYGREDRKVSIDDIDP